MKDIFRFSGKGVFGKGEGVVEVAAELVVVGGEEEEEEGVVGACGAVSGSSTASFRWRRRRRWRRWIWGDSFGRREGKGTRKKKKRRQERRKGRVKFDAQGRRRNAGRKEGKGEVRCPDFFFYSKL
ncbi:hypothetical protein TIFTF001_055386 [Ficus carica]|uniref:Uncharacterized protein n=1 Tax=Ficus carica TaxID=3494 RepID=A0AA88JIN7_FICCA|nr:hypothetical protein TIFTF001_055386 [Ficus carica]